MKSAALIITHILFTTLLYGQSIPDVQIDIPVEINNSKEFIGKKAKISESIDKYIFHKNEGQLHGSMVLNYHVKVNGAEALVIFFDELIVGDGVKIRAYSPASGFSTRNFIANRNAKTSTFALPYVPGEDVIVEITCTNLKAYEALSLKITEVGIFNSMKGFGDAPACFVNVNCSEGDEWANQKRSVARYMTVTNGELGFCTGSLVNNTSGDCKNYFLSAQHCGLGSTEEEFGQYVFYFNYEAAECSSPATDDGLDQQTVVGCSKLAESGGNTTVPPNRSDFLLVELNEIPEAYNVFYAGWNHSPVEQIQGVGAIIQHPLADLKKIAFWDNAETSLTSTDHLEFNCIASANGDGTVEGNSSGSPVFDINKNIVGNITAGVSGCISDNNFAGVIGGKFEVHWDQCGTTANRQLEPWLDPANSGVLFLNGKNQCNGVVAVDDIHEDHLVNIYPNPAYHRIQVETSFPIDRIDIYSVTGALLLTTANNDKVDVSSLSNGLFFVSIRTSNNISIIRKLIKKR